MQFKGTFSDLLGLVFHSSSASEDHQTIFCFLFQNGDYLFLIQGWFRFTTLQYITLLDEHLPAPQVHRCTSRSLRRAAAWRTGVWQQEYWRRLHLHLQPEKETFCVQGVSLCLTLWNECFCGQLPCNIILNWNYTLRTAEWIRSKKKTEFWLSIAMCRPCTRFEREVLMFNLWLSSNRSSTSRKLKTMAAQKQHSFFCLQIFEFWQKHQR